MRYKKNIACGGLLLVVGLSAVQSAAAATKVNFNFTARARLQGVCNVTATDMDFGSFATITGTETATSNVVVTCTKGTSYTVSLRNGQASAARNMTLRDAVGNTIRGTLTLGTTSGTTTATHVIVGRLNAQAFPPFGVYQSLRRVFVTF